MWLDFSSKISAPQSSTLKFGAPNEKIKILKIKKTT
jgi:hypothetical protein